MGGLADNMQRSLNPGQVVGGFYALITPLGKGAFGEVWKAQDLRTGDIVAVKMPLHQFVIDPKVITSLKCECGALKMLSHPNICRLIDFMYDPEYGPLLITEYVEGKDLKKAAAGLSWDDQMALFVQAFQGLNYLHSLQKPVMHLDIKPPNILVANGHLKLIDFGISGFRPPVKTAGTYSYMAPEMIIDAKTVNTRADLYSLGVVIYECLTGDNPFRTPDKDETKRRQREVVPVRPSEKNRTVPPLADLLVMRLLEKDQHKRYESAKEVLQELKLVHDKTSVDIAHLQSFAQAAGKFVGRRDVMRAIQSDYSNINHPGFFAHLVKGGPGTGKTRLLHEIGLDAKVQVDDLHTITMQSAAAVTPEVLELVASAITNKTYPIFLLIDDYDRWCVEAPQLANLLETLQTHPQLSTWIGCLISVSQIPDSLRMPGFRHHELKAFTLQEMTDYLGATAKVPEPQCSQLARQLWQYTEGNPGRLATAMTRLVAQGFFAAGVGQWDPSMFEDVTIEVTSSPDEENISPPEDVPQFLVETAETALARGKAFEALKVMDRFPDCCDGLVMLWKSILLTSIRENAAAQRTLETALSTARDNHDNVLELRIRNQRARILFRNGKNEEATAIYRQTASEEALLGANDRDLILNNELGYLLLHAGRFDEAEPILREHMLRAERAGNIRRAILAQAQLGDCLMHITDRMAEAREMLLAAIRRARAAQQQDVLSYAYNQFANSYVMEGEQKEGVEILKRAIPLNYFLNDLRAVATNTTNYGLGLIRNGDYEEAKHKLLVAYEYIRKNNDLIKECMVPCLVGQAEIRKHEAKLVEANALLDKAEATARQNGVWNENAYSILMTRAEVRQVEGDLKNARNLAIEAKPFARPGREQQEWDVFISEIKAWDDVEMSLPKV